MKILERDSECEKACNEKKCDEEVGGFGRVYIGSFFSTLKFLFFLFIHVHFFSWINIDDTAIGFYS